MKNTIFKAVALRDNLGGGGKIGSLVQKSLAALLAATAMLFAVPAFGADYLTDAGGAATLDTDDASDLSDFDPSSPDFTDGDNIEIAGGDSLSIVGETKEITRIGNITTAVPGNGDVDISLSDGHLKIGSIGAEGAALGTVSITDDNGSFTVELLGGVQAGDFEITADNGDELTVYLNTIGSDFDGTITTDNGGTVELFLLGNNAELEFDVQNAAALTYDSDSVFGWEINGNMLVANLNAPINLNDGYLAALSMHHRYAAWTAVRDRLISGGRNQRGILGQSCDDPCGSFGKSYRDIWVNYVGRSDTYRSSFNHGDWDLWSNGVQLGTDLFKSRRNQLGLLFGYENAKTTNANDRVEMDDFYFGAYAAHVFRGGVDVRAVFAYGWQDYGMNRVTNLGNHHSTSFKGNTTETNLELGKRYWGGACSMRPVLAIDIMTNDIGGATEVTSGLTYDKTSLTQVFLRTGTDFRIQRNQFTFNSGLYYAYNVNSDELKTTVRFPGGNMQLVGTNLGKSLLTFNVGGDYQLAKRWSVFGGYQGEYATDSAAKALQSTAYVGTGLKW